MEYEYEMSVLTEEQRKILINRANEVLSNSYYWCDKDADLLKIALSSLTTIEVGQVTYGESSGLSVEYCSDVVVGESLYTAPPVPALKPINLMRPPRVS